MIELRRQAICVLCSVLAVAVLAGPAVSQETAFLGVANVDQPLVDGRGKTLVEISRGELVRVLLKQGERYLGQTTTGLQGWVKVKEVTPLAEAAKIYDELIGKDSSQSAWYALRAMVWEQQGESKKAIADLDRAIELGHDDPHLFVNRGMFHAAEGRFDKAIADYDAALKDGLDEGIVYSNRAAAYLGKGDFQKAIADCDELIRRQPKDASGYYLRGVAHRQQGELAKAANDFSKVLEIEPGHIQARISRGFVYYLQEDSKRAIADFSEVIRLNPQHAVAYNNRGYNRQLIEDYSAALADFEEAIRLAPDYSLAYQNKAWLLATCPQDEIRDGQAAFTAAKKACELREWKVPSDFKALAAAYAECRDFRNATKWQAKVVEASEGEQRAEEQKILELYRASQPYRSDDS